MVMKDDGPSVWTSEEDFVVESTVEQVDAGVAVELSVHLEKTESRNSTTQ